MNNPVLETKTCGLCGGSGENRTYTWPVHCEPSCVEHLTPYDPGYLLCNQHTSMPGIYLPVLWTELQRDATIRYREGVSQGEPGVSQG